MKTLKTKSLQEIEQKMESLDINSLRYKILEAVKNFKTSWIDLGQALFTVYKDKLYKDWGYNQFETYISKELGIRKPTAMKLLRSYYFLEKEAPLYLKKDFADSSQASAMPTYESIDILRLAKNKKFLDEKDYVAIKKDVLEKGKDFRQVKKDLTALIREREELSPEEAWEKKKVTKVRRLLGLIKALKEDIQISKLLPASILKETDSLIKKLEAELD
jgi:hypothetical protein